MSAASRGGSAPSLPVGDVLVTSAFSATDDSEEDLSTISDFIDSGPPPAIFKRTIIGS
jgi:hypothetical protein